MQMAHGNAGMCCGHMFQRVDSTTFCTAKPFHPFTIHIWKQTVGRHSLFTTLKWLQSPEVELKALQCHHSTGIAWLWRCCCCCCWQRNCGKFADLFWLWDHFEIFDEFFVICLLQSKKTISQPRKTNVTLSLIATHCAKKTREESNWFHGFLATVKPFKLMLQILLNARAKSFNVFF